MKIGIDARYALSKNRRGIGNYIYALINYYQFTDNRFILYADKNADQLLIDALNRDNIIIKIINAPNFALWEHIALPLAAKQDGVDLLHCPANMAPVFFKPCPIITTIHDVIEFRRDQFGDTKLSLRHRLSRLYRMGVLPRVACVSDAIITVSQFSKRDIVNVLRVPEEKVKVIYNATDKLGLNKPDKPSLAGLSNKYIFAFGAVDKRKNTEFLIKAYNALPQEIKAEVHLVVAGIEKPEAFAHLSGEGVHLLGFISEDEKQALYSNALCFVFPSLYEGFGLPVIEAMSVGIPVLCSGTTAVGEVAGNAALLTDPTNLEDFQRKLIDVISNAELRVKLSEQGILHAKNFSWEKCAQETLALYEQVFNAGKEGAF